MTGSSFPSRADWVGLRPNWSSTSDDDGVALAAAARAPLGGLLALVAAQQLQHLLADPVEVGSQLDQDLRRDALALADQAEQDVLGADVVMASIRASSCARTSPAAGVEANSRKSAPVSYAGRDPTSTSPPDPPQMLVADQVGQLGQWPQRRPGTSPPRTTVLVRGTARTGEAMIKGDAQLLG